MSLEIQHDKEAKKFHVSIKGEEAHLLYRDLPEGNLDFYSTFVPTSARGMGIAGKLVEAGITYAKEKNSKILPSCSYVKVQLQKSSKLQELALD